METEWPRMTVDTLKDCNKKFLAQMAKDQGIVGWHAMRKDQLIRALSVPPNAPKKSHSKTAATPKATATTEVAQRRAPAVVPPSRPLPMPALPPRALDHACIKDQIVAV